jgi:hypothetical protein
MRLSTVFGPHVLGLRRYGAVPLVLVMGVLCVGSGLGSARAADEPKPAVAADPGEKDQAEKPPREFGRPVRPVGHEFMTALALWCTVLVIGLALLAMIVVWGRSVRTLARRRPIAPTAPDPLWYLKAKPPAPTDPSHHIDDSEPGSEISGQTPL